MFQNLCSFCYICGKEIKFYEFHQCPMFDSNIIADKIQDVTIDLTEKSHNIATTANEEQSDLNKTLATQTWPKQDPSNDNATSPLLPLSSTPIACIQKEI